MSFESLPQLSRCVTEAASQTTTKSLAFSKTSAQSSVTKASSSAFMPKPTSSAKGGSSSLKSATDSKYPSAGAKPARSRSPPPLKPQFSKSLSAPRSGAAPLKKRPRSPSLSLSPPPSKRRAASPENSLRSEIWKLFGKDRNSYVARDVLSDDEDMEADASALMKEELRRLVDFYIDVNAVRPDTPQCSSCQARG